MGSKIIYTPDPDRDLELFREYLLQRERTKSTIENYIRNVKFLLRFSEDRPAIDKETLIDFKDYLWEHYKPVSCNTIIAGVNQFLESLGLEDLKLKRFRLQDSMMRAQARELTIEECKKLIETAVSQKKDRLAIAMEAIAMTGARISELKYFTVESVKEGQIQVRNKGKIRIILLPDVLKQHLLLYAAKHRISKGSIFITSGGKPVDRSNFWREMQQIGAELHMEKEKLFPHNLRHLFAHVYFEETKDLAGLGDLLGHSSLNVTRIYTMKTMETQKKTLNRICSALEDGGKLAAINV